MDKLGITGHFGGGAQCIVAAIVCKQTRFSVYRGESISSLKRKLYQSNISVLVNKN